MIKIVLFMILLIIPYIGICAENQIKNFKFGLMKKAESGEWYVYKEGNQLLLTINGKCTYNKKVKDCMWRGIEFNYAFENENTILTCEKLSSRASNYGNPEKVIEKHTKKYEFDLTLHDKKGRKTVPGYTVYSFNYEDNNNAVKCYYKGELLIDYQYKIIAPSLIDWITEKYRNNY